MWRVQGACGKGQVGCGLKILTVDFVTALVTIDLAFELGIELSRLVWYKECGSLRTPMIVQRTGGCVGDGACCSRLMICFAGCLC